MNEEQRAILHDVKHYIRLVTSVNGFEDKKHISDLIKKLNTEIENNERQLISDAPILDVLLSERKRYADNNGIEFNVSVEPGLQFGETGEADYIIMLSNILDNATEAASNADNKKIVEINVFRSENSGFIVCKVLNTFNINDVRIVGGELISTKKHQGIHGYGIKNIEKSAERHGGSFSIVFKDELAVSTLVLPI